MKKYILGVKIDDVNIRQALEIVEKWIWNPGKHYIVTPNPEFIVAAQKDQDFKEILNRADMAIPDGVGLKLARDIENTISGVDFMEEVIKLASEKGFTTGFLGGRDGVAEKTAECLKKKYPGLKVIFADSGGEVENNGDVIARSQSNEAIFPSSRLPRPFGARNDKGSVDLLFVAFGPPKQEKWIAKNLPHVPVKLAMGVGGAFDFFSGKVPRAPKWVRRLGFEWLFRLIIQPWRVKRQISLVKFIFYILRTK